MGSSRRTKATLSGNRRGNFGWLVEFLGI